MRISDWSSDVCSSDLKLEQGLVRDRRIGAARVNFTEKRVRLSCAPDAETPDLIGAFTLLGFEAHPIGAGPAQVDRGASDSRALLRAVGVSGFAMMNIMLLSVSVWSGADGATRDLFHWLSAAIAHDGKAPGRARVCAYG